MIYFIDNILNKNELDILQKQCYNFIQDKNSNGYYNRMRIDENIVSMFSEKLKKIIFETLNLEYILIPKISTWLNCVNNKTNQNDTFHTDISEISIVIYLNEDFKGGELEYKDETGNKKTYIPKINSGIIMTNKLLHRVLPVIKGKRFSIVSFLENKNIKIKKTLL